MATVTYTQDLTGSGTTWVALHAQNILKWYDYDDPTAVEWGELKVEDGDANIVTLSRIAPRISDSNLKVNISEVLLSMMNDITDASDYSSVVYPESGLYDLFYLTPKVFTSGALTEAVSSNLVFACRGVMQLNPRWKADVIEANPFSAIYKFLAGASGALCLLSDGEAITDNQRLVYFIGYPLDFTMISSLAGGGGYLYSINGVSIGRMNHLNRITIGDGDSESAFVNNSYAVADGDKIDLAITAGGLGFTHTLELDVVDRCGVYLRWLNYKGGYSYWLFSRVYQEAESVKINDLVTVDLDDMGGSANIRPTGYDGTKSIALLASGVNDWQMLHIQEVVKSIDVKMYLQPQGTANPDPDESWERMYIESSQITLVDTKKKIFNVRLSFTRNRQNYQSL